MEAVFSTEYQYHPNPQSGYLCVLCRQTNAKFERRDRSSLHGRSVHKRFQEEERQDVQYPPENSGQSQSCRFGYGEEARKAGLYLLQIILFLDTRVFFPPLFGNLFFVSPKRGKGEKYLCSVFHQHPRMLVRRFWSCKVQNIRIFAAVMEGDCSFFDDISFPPCLRKDFWERTIKLYDLRSVRFAPAWWRRPKMLVPFNTEFFPNRFLISSIVSWSFFYSFQLFHIGK